MKWIVALLCLLAASFAQAQTLPGPSSVSPTVWNPPPITSPVTVQNGQLMCGGQRWVGAGFNFTGWSIGGTLIASNSQGPYIRQDGLACLRAQLRNISALGGRVVRINDWDTKTGSNCFTIGSGPQTTTRQLDPMFVQAMGIFFDECAAANLRVILTLHQGRILVPGDAPPWPCPTFNEIIALNKGSMNWYDWVDPGVELFKEEFDNQVLKAIAAKPALMIVGLENENPFSRAPLFATTIPAFQSQLNIALQAFCAYKGFPYKTPTATPFYFPLNKPQIAEFCAWQAQQVLSQRAANIRKQYPNLLIIAGNYFGNLTYAEVAPLQAVGDVMDCHFYPEYAPNDICGFLSGQMVSDVRSRFSAVLAGCNLTSAAKLAPLPLCASEVGFQNQVTNTNTDSPAVISQSVDAAITSLVNQDASIVTLYAMGHAALFDNTTTTVNAYDLRVQPSVMANLQASFAKFNDLRLRPTASTTIAPTSGLYGTKDSSGNYTVYGPYTDEALYAVPAGQKVTVSP